MPNGDHAAGGVGNMLTQRWGGVPVWIYVAGAAGIGGLGLYFYNKKQAASNAATAQQSTGAPAGNASTLPGAPPVTYITGIPDSNTGLNSSTATGANVQTSAIVLGPTPGQPNAGVFSQAVAAYPGPSATGQYTLLPFGSYSVAGNVQNGLYPVKGPGTSTLWVQGQNVASFTGGGGMGGAGIGTTPWQSFTQGWHTPQYVFGGMGAGPGAGAAHVAHIAARAKMPAARLKAINPHLRATGYRAGPSHLVRIA